MNWKGLIDDRDLNVAKLSDMGKRVGWGKKPALVIIDGQYDFVGLNAPIEESVKVYRRSIGEEAWVAAKQIRNVLRAARTAGLPVYYSQQWNPEDERRFDSFARKQSITGTVKRRSDQPNPEDIMKEIAPKNGDVVIKKRYASIFSGTPFSSFLVKDGVDTLIVCGYVTSGCVRGTVVDGHAHCYRNIIVADACADRFHSSHTVSLFDMDMKYGDVVTAGETVDWLKNMHSERTGSK